MSGDVDCARRAEHVAAIARGLVETFGDRATEVARRQRALAADDVAATWDAILAALGRDHG